jgi:hypothetical protein
VSAEADIFGTMVNIPNYAADGSFVHGSFSYPCHVAIFHLKSYRASTLESYKRKCSCLFALGLSHAVPRFYTFRIFRREYCLEEVLALY